MEPTGFLARKGWKLRHESPTGCRCLNRRRRTNAKKNNPNHPDSAVSGSGDVVQLRLSPVGYHPVNDKFTAAGMDSKSNLGVEIMAVAGVVLALVGVAFLLACCLMVGSRDNENE